MDEVSAYFLFWLAVCLGLLAAVAVLQTAGALLNRLAIRQNWFTITFAAGAVAACFIGGPLYLDATGAVVPGTVIKVDGVDLGSVPGLPPGTVLPVTSPGGASRAVRLTRATRDHAAASWAQAGPERWFSLTGIAGLLLVTLALRRVTRRAGRWVEARLAEATRRTGR